MFFISNTNTNKIFGTILNDLYLGYFKYSKSGEMVLRLENKSLIYTYILYLILICIPTTYKIRNFVTNTKHFLWSLCFPSNISVISIYVQNANLFGN